jgi:hypothetical protein
MARTARKEDEKKEYFDPLDVLEKKVDQLVLWIKESKHMIAFTGAGISTAAGIPDFRSGMNTSLQTGPGVWELRAKKTARDSKHKVTTTVKAIPTPTHMMLVKLHEEGLLKCCISQNTDGLHRRSGLPKSGKTNIYILYFCVFIMNQIIFYSLLTLSIFQHYVNSMVIATWRFAKNASENI